MSPIDNNPRRHHHHQSPHPSHDVFDRFEIWLRDNGAEFEQLELREYDTDTSGSDGYANPKDGSSDLVSASSLSLEDAEEKKESPSDIINVSASSSSSDDSSSSSSQRGGNNNHGGGGQGQGGANDDFDESSSEMRGVIAKTSIPPNTVCMAVPRRCLITVEMGQQTDIGKCILRSDLDLDAPKHIFLMVYVLQDRLDPTSFFRPYYDILPRTLSNMPIFWSAEELRFLEGSYLLTQIEDRLEAIEEDYRSICDVCPALGEIATLDEFKWARMVVCSRNFGLQIDGNRTSALVPHADMLNHYRPRETKWTFDEERQAFTITTLQTIQAGSEIYDSYGQKCNHRFLLNYGFAIENNVELDGFCPNEVPLQLTVRPTDDTALFDRKMDFWCREDTPAIKRVRVCVSNNENTKVLFSMLRVVVADEREFEAICATGGGGGGGGGVSGGAGGSASAANIVAASGLVGAASSSLRGVGAGLGMLVYRTCRDIRFPLGLRNERAALKHLLSVVRGALGRYPTTLRQDNERLAASPPSSSSSPAGCGGGSCGVRSSHNGGGGQRPTVVDLPQFSNARHALIQVRGEKEVLHHYEDLAVTALRVIDLEDDDQFDAAIKGMEGMGKHPLVVRYCADVLGSTRREERRRLGRAALLSCAAATTSAAASRVMEFAKGGGGGGTSALDAPPAE